jgi:hypothetical protein
VPREKPGKSNVPQTSENDRIIHASSWPAPKHLGVNLPADEKLGDHPGSYRVVKEVASLESIVTIPMFVAILPVCSLLRSVEFVEGTISFMPFRPPAPVPAVFAVIPSVIVPVVPVVIPPLSGVLTAVVSKIVAALEPYRGNKSQT